MPLPILTGLVVLSWLAPATALAHSGWQERSQNASRAAAIDKRVFVSAAVIVTRLSTLYLAGDPSKTRTADFGFDFQINYEFNIWGFCATTVVDASDCDVAGKCFDNVGCSSGCGGTKNPYRTITCARDNNQFCSVALLSPQRSVPLVTFLACGDEPATDVFLGFTSDVPAAVVTSTRSTTSTTSPNPAASDSQQPLTSGPANTKAPTQSNAAEPSGQSSNGGGVANNVGAIIGGAVGCLAILCGFGFATLWLRRRKKNAKADSSSALSDDLPDVPPDFKLEGPSELSARSLAAYDTATFRLGPPRTPLELAQSMGPVELPVPPRR